MDYTERFTASASAEVDATQGNLSGTISIVNNNPTLGSFDVVISNVKAPNGVETVSVPIWSEINGQDDIIWYTCLLYTSPSPRDYAASRMPSSA